MPLRIKNGHFRSAKGVTKKESNVEILAGAIKKEVAVIDKQKNNNRKYIIF